jgi:outer membrane protein assembly factor BamB
MLSLLPLVASLICLQTPYTDPAPPKLETITGQAKVAEAFPGLKFHAAPKPLAVGATIQNWPGILGPDRNGTSKETPLVAQFPKPSPSIVWEIPKGEGYATPTVIGERVILFHRMGSEDVVDCLQAETGKRFWHFTYPTTYKDDWGFNGGPRCQPVTDGESVFTLSAEGKLHSIDLLTGHVRWKRDLIPEFKLEKNFFGFGATPLLEGGLIILQLGADKGPTVAAFDKNTGKLAWGAGKDWSAGYAAPVVATINGLRCVFVFAGGKSSPPDGGLMGIDAANGKVLFTHPYRSRQRLSVNGSMPVVLGNRVLISECYGEGGTMLEIDAKWALKVVWHNPSFGTHFMTAVEKGGYLYGIDGHGPRNAPLVCVDAKDGKEMWRHEPEWTDKVKTMTGMSELRLGPGLASLMQVDGRCLMPSEYGHLAWLDLNPKGYKELDRTMLFAAPESWGMPALSKGLLYLNQNNQGIDGSPARLLCIDLRGAAKAANVPPK